MEFYSFEEFKSDESSRKQYRLFIDAANLGGINSLEDLIEFSKILTLYQNLTTLYLITSTESQDCDISIILDSLKECANLNSLRLEFSYESLIDDTTITEMASSLPLLSKLTYLEINLSGDIENNNFGNQAFSQLAASFIKLPYLTTLTLNFCNKPIDVGLLTCLGSSLQLCHVLSSLDCNFSYNGNISGEEISIFVEHLQKCEHLSKLNLNLVANKMGIPGAKLLGISLNQLIQLRSLSLSLNKNEIGEEECLNLSSAFTQCSHLNELFLNLNENQINNQGLINLQPMFAKFSKIKKMSILLENNRIDDQGITVLLTSLLTCQLLESLALRLAHNNIGILGLSSIETTLKDLVNLKKLELFLCEIDSEQCQCLTQMIQNLKLKSVTLFFSKKNSINNEDITKLGKVLVENTNLQNLSLSFSQTNITEEGMNNITKFLGLCQNLISLVLFISDSYYQLIQTQRTRNQLLKTKRLTQLYCSL